ncbi:MAG: hypothetical protein Kow00117_01300 [Phototrophicales bacterium]
MYKFMIIFRQPVDVETFERHYVQLLGLVERMPNIERRQVINVMGSPMGRSPYYRILEIYFQDRETMEAALMSPIGQEAGAELYQFPQFTFEILFAEVYEEAGGRSIAPNPYEPTEKE